jgi:multisubunit Na+/H+ antiporter MnhF subunit
MTFVLWVEVLMVVVSLSMVICFARLYLGPTTPDRTVAFDLISVHAVGLLVLASMRFEDAVLLDAALITAILGFLGTVMFAHFIEQSPAGDEED